MPAKDLLGEFLNDLRRGQEAVAKSRVQVEFKRNSDAKTYTLTSLDKRSLEQSVQQRMDEAEHAEHGGFAQFLTPWRTKEGVWMTRGEVVIFAAPAEVTE